MEQFLELNLTVSIMLLPEASFVGICPRYFLLSERRRKYHPGSPQFISQQGGSNLGDRLLSISLVWRYWVANLSKCDV